MTAIDRYGGDIGKGGSLESPDDAALRLRASADEDADVVGTAVRDLSDKGERTVTGNGQVVAGVVLQNHLRSLTGGDIETNDLSADGVENSGANDLNIGDVRGRGARAASDSASLRRARGLSQNGHRICAAAGNQACKLECAICGNGEIIATVILQHEPGASQSGDGTTD